MRIPGPSLIFEPRVVKPWERQPGESGRAFAAFVAYRDTGDSRSYTGVAQTLHKSRTLVARWGTRWRWQDRLSAWERNLEYERQVAHRRAIIEMNERHVMIAQQCQQKICGKLRSMGEQEINDLSVSDLAKLLAISVAVERSALGLSPSSKLTPVEQDAFMAIPRPEGDMISDLVKQLSPIDRSLLRDISVKYLKVAKLEAELSAQAPQTDSAQTDDEPVIGYREPQS
jgi:hypothetical protein